MKSTAKYQPTRRDSLPVIRSGYAEIREGSRWWKRRWVVLKDDALRFQESALTTKDRTVILHTTITKVERSLVKPFCLHLQITTNNSGKSSSAGERSLFLSFAGESELYEWLDDIHSRSPLSCSNPFSFEHRVHVQYDQGGYTGLPPQWTALRRSSLSPFTVSPPDTPRRSQFDFESTIADRGNTGDNLGSRSNEMHNEKRQSVGGTGSTLSRVVSSLSRVSRRFSTTPSESSSSTTPHSMSKRFSAPPGQMTSGPTTYGRRAIGHIKMPSMASQLTFMGSLGAVKESDDHDVDVDRDVGDDVRKESVDDDDDDGVDAVVMSGEYLVNIASENGVLGLMKKMTWQRRTVTLTQRIFVVSVGKGWRRDQRKIAIPLSGIASVNRVPAGSKPNELLIRYSPSVHIHISFERDSELYDWQDALLHRSRCTGIGLPSNFRHHVHVHCDPTSMNYAGLPDEWRRILQTPHILAPSTSVAPGPFPTQSRPQTGPPPAYNYHRRSGSSRRPRTAPSRSQSYNPPTSLESEIRRDVTQIGHVEGGYIEQARRLKHRSDSSALVRLPGGM
ncbi:hypothetical protein BDN72DRAFT_901736 [Pluteus cervinus]|uniref:Uncharacterized protein n=1 Tax=Pluteus cervinus TaxID=181527 RepID=A0ACD3AF45_9AGAR|nr:hypothetical protein BDN72DRAFT_901736 [Pluteus cervinus]